MDNSLPPCDLQTAAGDSLIFKIWAVFISSFKNFLKQIMWSHIIMSYNMSLSPGWTIVFKLMESVVFTSSSIRVHKYFHTEIGGTSSIPSGQLHSVSDTIKEQGTYCRSKLTSAS